MEVLRVTHSSGAVLQWYEAERAMVLDIVTGEPQRLPGGHNSVGTLEQALELAAGRCSSRYVIVKLPCIVQAVVDQSHNV
jgi:hypothetical protein